MKDHINHTTIALLLCSAFVLSVQAQTNIISYQGHLTDGGSPASGLYNLSFELFTDPVAGSSWAAATNTAVSVTNGLFTVQIDVGPGVFDGTDLWLEVGAVTNGGGSFSILTPRQQITQTPYAFFAADAAQLNGFTESDFSPSAHSHSGSYADLSHNHDSSYALLPHNHSGTYAILSHNHSGSYALLSHNHAGTYASVSHSHIIGTNDLDSTVLNSTFWRIDGNGGTTDGTHYLGTSDNQPLDLRVNNTRGLRMEYPSSGSVPNLTGGYDENTIDAGAEGSVISGGGASFYLNKIGSESDYGVIGGGRANVISSNANSSTISGGEVNNIGVGAYRSTIGGGSFNSIDTIHSTIAGGIQNNISSGASESTIGGGYNNAIGTGSLRATISGGRNNDIGANSFFSIVGGGWENNIANSASYAVIPGGDRNDVGAGANYAFAAGRRAQANHSGTFVWADSTDADFASTASDQFLVRASGGVGLGHWPEFGHVEIQQPSDDADGGLAIANTSRQRTLRLWADGSNNSRIDSGGSGDFPLLLNGSGSGSVGIGTTNPVATLGIAGGNWNLAASEGDFRIGNSTYRLKIGVAQGGGGAGAARIHAAGGIATLYLGSNGSNTVIIANGRMGVNRSATANPLEVEGDASKTVAGSWLANSDVRIKQDIQPVSSALETLDRVRLVSFEYTDDYKNQHPSVGDRRYLNVVAQEFREVFPDSVKSSGEKLPDGSEILQVDTYPLTIYSAAAIQELKRDNEELRNELEVLRQAIEQLKERAK